ncbi:unnamed protein product [Auanema sp. JU1783]|nr:unnamed protein product [Auanema sp. JU1783]
MISAKTIIEAYERISSAIHKTPIITSRTINRIAGCEVFFKCDHLQKTGSFKARGAYNSTKLISQDPNCKGVITHSSGNHGQALAWAAEQIGLKCVVVVPKNAPTSKIDAMEEYNAEIHRCENSIKAREETCEHLSEELGYPIVPPYDSIQTINGQGTIAVELIEQIPDLDAVFLSIGGGGLASGVAAYIGEHFPNIRVFLVEPAGKELGKYLFTGVFENQQEALDTVADGIRVHKIGSICFPIIQKFCKSNIITVTEEEISEAVKLIWTRTKQRVEPTAGVPLAGLLKSNLKDLNVKKAAVILCGGNVDITYTP